MAVLRATIAERFDPAATADTGAVPSDVARGNDTATRSRDWWRPVVKQAVFMWLVTRVVLALVTYAAVLLTAAGTPVNYAPGAPGFHSFTIWQLAQSWNRWDTVHFLDIARNGYYAIEPTAFFPLYPMLVRAVMFPLGNAHALLAGLIVSNLAVLGAFAGVGLLAAGEEPADANRAGLSAIRVLAAYPLAFFLTAAYTDGLFLAFAAFSLFFGRRGRWGWAAGMAFAAGFTRLTSVVLIAPLLFEYYRQHEWRAGAWRERLLRLRPLAEMALVVAAVPAAIGMYFTFLWVRFGSPMTLFTAERIYWSHVSTTPWNALHVTLHKFIHTPIFSYWQARTLVDLAPLLLVALLTLFVMRRQPLSFTLLTAGVLFLSIISPIPHRPDVLASAGRYMLAAAPIFVLLGQWSRRRPWLDMLLVSGGFMLQAVLLLCFLTGYWIV
ncbi:MAG TPA: mannosyltransferase family protein [Ktedonobacterales bacterium]|nr:mannosyltransferase family protein [Ktedonobacterales bacterium]